MKNRFENIRNVKIVQSLPSGPVYTCSLDLFLYNEDPITGETHISPDSGTVEYVAHPDDVFGFGPSVYQSIQNGEFEGTIEDMS